MLKEGIPVGRLFGISIRLHYSWFIIFALVIWALSRDYFPMVYPHWSAAISVSAGVITSLLFFASLLAHELMHSLVAQRYGIPVKAITLFIFGGVSQITEEPHDARTEFRIAIAGPLTSITLGGIFWLLWYLLPPSLDVAAVSFWLGWINIFLALFNLVPGFPLDGGRVLRSIIWWRTGSLRRATRLASNIGRGIGFIFISGGVWLVFTGDWSSGIWLGLIGWFLASAAANSYRQMVIQQALEGHEVSEIVSSDCIAVSPDLSIERLVNEYIRPTGRRCFVVVREGITLGLVTLQEVKGVLRDMRARIVVAQIMKPIDKLMQVTPDEDLSTVLNILTQENLNQVPVMVDGQMVGMVTRESLLNFVSRHERKSS
ncbi:MAG: site-2 protease family protein [Dehalococcoidia bacterium]|nr:MAG: site-2 protease family protein [Dehalococcoidia bacterium]